MFEEDTIEWFVNEMVSTAQVCGRSLSCLVWNLCRLQVLLCPSHLSVICTSLSFSFVSCRLLS